jgi:hypothetical protein
MRWLPRLSAIQRPNAKGRDGWKQEVQCTGSEQPLLLEEPAIAGLLELKPDFMYISIAGSHTRYHALTERTGEKRIGP